MAEMNQAPASGGKTSKKLSTRVDLTAMVDLAFLLVTFFMLTTTLSKPKAILLGMPEPGPEGAVAASRTVTLCLGRDNQLVYYRGEVDKPLDGPLVASYNKNGLRRSLLDMSAKVKAETGHAMIVVIKPGVHSVYDNLVSAIDELNITSSKTYAVVDISAKDNELLKQKNLF